jgi:hypothetical protein
MFTLCEDLTNFYGKCEHEFYCHFAKCEHGFLFYSFAIILVFNNSYFRSFLEKKSFSSDLGEVFMQENLDFVGFQWPGSNCKSHCLNACESEQVRHNGSESFLKEHFFCLLPLTFLVIVVKHSCYDRTSLCRLEKSQMNEYN